jgi:hypothetical protein
LERLTFYTVSVSLVKKQVTEDHGGNSVDVRVNGRKENLHSFWDTALVELEQGTPSEIAA